jgi:hypothetical protein
MRYRIWQSRDLAETERALLAAIVGAWRAGRDLDRERAEFALVQAGHAYREAHASYDVLEGRSCIRSVPTPDGARRPVPTLAGLIELGDEDCEADLDSLSRITEALRALYHPDRKRVSLDQVCEASGLVRSDVLRLAPFTGVYEVDAFQLGNQVLGWDSFDEFLRAQVIPRRPAPRDVEARPHALQLELLPTAISWTNLGPFQEATLELSPLTVLIGANASGKTSALRALRLISSVAHRGRSEERRVGKECRRLCRSRWSPYH